MNLRGIAKQPSVTELPKQQIRFVIAQRFNSETYDYLGIGDDPLSPLWIPSHLANVYYAEQIKLYFKKHTDLTEFLFVPHAEFYKNGKVVSIFHYPPGDLYTEKIQIEQLPIELPQKAPDFGAVDSCESAAAKTLIFPYPAGKSPRDYAKIKGRLEQYALEEIDSECYSSWGVNIDVVMLVVEYYKFKGKDRLCIFGFNNYYTLCSELYKYGIFCSRNYDDDVNCCIIDDPNDESLKFEYETVIAAAPYEIKSRKKFLILEHAEYKECYAEFLFPAVKNTEILRKLFLSVELGYISSIFNASHKVPAFLAFEPKTPENGIFLGSTAYIFTYQPDLCECARVKAFLDTDIVAQRFFGDNKTRKEKISTKSAIAHLNFGFHSLGGILKALWTSSGQDRSTYTSLERMRILSLIIDSALFFGFHKLLVIVPDELLTAVHKYLSALNIFEIKTSAFQAMEETESQEKQLWLLPESAIYALSLTQVQFSQCIKKEMLPNFVIFPFTSTRQMEVITEQLYIAAHAAPPCMFTVVAEDSVEEQLLAYRQQLSCESFQEFVELSENVQVTPGAGRPEQYYECICNIIEERGFDGNYHPDTHVYDYARLGIAQEPNESVVLCDKFCELSVNRFNENELILQASLQGIFSINKNFSIRILFQLIYGSRFETASRNSQFYKSSSLAQLEIELLEKMVPYYSLDQIYSFYYLCNTNFDKGVQVYNNNQFPSIMNQQAVLDQVNKYAANCTGQAPQTLLENFLKLSKEARICEFHSYNVKPEKSLIKEYCYIPIYKLPATNNQSFTQISVFQRNNPLERPVTLCAECALFTKQKPYFFGKTCDMCDKAMESIADDCQAYRHTGNSNSVFKISHLIESQDENTSEFVDFIENVNLCTVSYAGGARWDNIVLRGTESDFIQNFESSFEKMLDGDLASERIVEAMNLLDSTRAYEFSGLYYGIKEEDSLFQVAALRYAISDYVLRNNGIITTEQINSFEYVPFCKIVKSVVNYELFMPRNELASVCDLDDIINFEPCTSLYDSVSQLLLENAHSCADFKEYVQFVVLYYKHIRLTTLNQRFSQAAAYLFLESLIKCYLGQLNIGIEATEELISVSTFYTKCIAFDSLIVENVMTNIMFFGPKESIFNEIKISMRHFMTQELLQQANLFAIHRYYSQLVKTVSSNGSSSFLPREETNTIIANAKAQANVGLLNKIPSYGYNTVSFLLGFSNLDTDIRVYNSDISGFSFFETSKKFIPRKFVLNQQMQKVPSSVPQTPRQEFSAERAGQPLTNSSGLQFPNKPIIAKTRNFTDTMQQKLIPDISLVSGRNTPQNKPFEPSSNAHPLPLTTPSFYFVFESTIKNLLTISIAPLIRRLSDHFYPFALYSKRNILYVPNVREIQSSDILNYVFNQFLPKECNVGDDGNFEPLIQILARDFSLEHGEGKLYRYIRNDYKAKLMEIISKNTPETMWYYDNCQLLLQHMIKRYVLCSADFNKELLYAFCQDPVMGAFETENGPGKTVQMRYCLTSDAVYDLTERQAQQLCDKYFELCANSPETQQILANLVKIGLNIGSTPLDIYKYFFMGKEDEISLVKIHVIQAIYTLIIICHHFKLKFPLILGDKQLDAENLAFLVRRQETIKLVTLKIESQSYITYLESIANLQSASVEDKRYIEDIITRHTTYNEDIILSDKSEAEKLALIRDQALLIERMNAFEMSLDQKYARFYTSDKPGMQFKQQNFDKFAINELDRCGIRKAYVYACQYKMLFLALFGMSAQTITNFRLTKQISQQEFDYIIELYASILNIWSRFHDYIFYICMTECGYENTYGRISESENKRQYFEPLKNSLFYKDLPIEQSFLYKYYQNLYHNLAQSQSEPFLYEEIAPELPQYPAFSPFAGEFRSPTTQQILAACQGVKAPNMFPIDAYQFDQRFCQIRQDNLVLALFYERILYSDPLQNRIIDPEVDLFSDRQHVIKQPELLIREIPDIKELSPGRRAAASPIMQEEKISPTTQVYKMGRAALKARTHIPEGIEKEIEAQPLEYYRTPREEIEKFVRAVIRAQEGDEELDLEQLLFFNSSCQKEKADVWGRLYSFLIAESPASLDTLTDMSHQELDSIKNYAVSVLHIDNAVSGSALFETIEKCLCHVTSQQRSIVNEINKLITAYIRIKLDIAYYHAFSLRDDLIEKNPNIKAKREEIHKALESIEIMNKGPLNDLIQRSVQNKRKMALATFIFLNTGKE